MFVDSYDATGIKFGIVISENLKDYDIESISRLSVNELLDEMNSSNTLNIIDFKEVDGLTPNEILSTVPNAQSKEFVLFVAYNLIEYQTAAGIKMKKINIMDIIAIPDETVETIDEILENQYIREYKSRYVSKERIANCFLQRYKYGTKEKTDQVLKEKVLQKNNND